MSTLFIFLFLSVPQFRFSGVERGFKGKPYPRLVKIVLSATLTQDPSKLSQLDLHHPLFLTTGKRRYQFPEKLESYKLVCRISFGYFLTVLNIVCVPFKFVKTTKNELVFCI